ncbi:MAG: ATP-binding cassette domain-containing protein [Dehalococcoidia bacterium]
MYLSGVVRGARELLDVFGLTAAADRKFETYSKGMKRKLTFAAGMIHEPPILFLDELATGIDVASARQVRQIISDLHSRGNHHLPHNPLY